MQLSYLDTGKGQGKTSENMDEVEVKFVKLIARKKIVQKVKFESEDPDFSGIMRMTWNLSAGKNGTLITVIAENVPPGIRKEDHIDGMTSTLNNLELYLRETGQETNHTIARNSWGQLLKFLFQDGRLVAVIILNDVP